MIIGIDFDNTIINYNDFFYRAGLSLGVLPENTDFYKKSIRDYLIEQGREPDWIKIQGLVYGKYIQNAPVMGGFSFFSELCYKKGWKIFIVSHKTREPKMGERFNLHDSALNWLEKNRIYGPGIRGAVDGVFFESTQSQKISRINHLGCDIVIDDLAEVLMHPDLGTSVMKILYAPEVKNRLNTDLYFTATSWDQMYDLISGKFGLLHGKF